MIEFERTVFELLDSNPFFAHLLMSVRRNFTTDNRYCKTLQVTMGSSPILTVNKNYFLSLNTKQRVGALTHEMLHLVLRHNRRMTSHTYTDQPHVANVACDLAVNQLIPPEQIHPHWENIERYKLEPNKTAEWYFNELMKKIKKGEIKVTYAFNGEHGCVVPCDDDLENQITVEGLIKSAYNKAKESGGVGKIPGELLEYIENIVAPPKVPWNKLVRQFIPTMGRAIVKTTIMRESKRYGTIPGIKIRGGAKLLVAIDTSGSISKDDLELFDNEIYHLRRNGVEIDIMLVDTKVYSVKPYRNRLSKIEGRGGTDLTAIFEWVKTHKCLYDGIVVLTDGYTSPAIPETPMVSCKVLWVINRGQQCSKWGKTIHIDQ